MQLLMEPVTRLDMLSDARSFRTRIWRDVNESNNEFQEEFSYCGEVLHISRNGAL
jgi:hypothetical protein